MENIQGKVVIITGASSGIGAETARVLAANRAKLVLSARREDRLKAISEEIGENAIYLKSDVSSPKDMQALVILAKEKFGKADALFANAGIMPAGNMSELKTGDWARMVEINVMGVLNSIEPSETKKTVEEFYKNVGLVPSAIANAVLYALSQPNEVDVSEITVRPTREV